MDVLINLNKCNDHIIFDIQNQQHKVKIVGTIDNPYFCGKDVCCILGYVSTKNALQNHVKSKYKKDLKTLNDEVGIIAMSTFLGSSNLQNLSYNEGKAVYINEQGLYSLIMHSKTKFAEGFQDLVYEQILPSIRKHGSYTLEQEFQAKLDIKDKELKEKDKKVLRMKTFVDSVSIRPKNEWIYIATTEQYAANNHFKIGSTKRLSKRIIGYQTGRASTDKMFYCWVYKCHNASKIDDVIKNLLHSFLEKERSEMYILHFEDLVDIVEFICDNFEQSVEYVNKFIKERLESSIEKTPIIPQPIQIETVDLVVKNINDEIEQVFNLSNMNRSEIEKLLFEKLELIETENKEEDPVVISRKDFLENFTGNKKELWDILKTITKWKNSKTPLPERNIIVKY